MILIRNLFSLRAPDSMLDGTPTLRMNEFVLAALESGKIPLDLVSGEKPGKVEIEELEFVVDDKIKGLVEGAKKNFADSLSKHDLKVRFLVKANN